MLTEIKKRMDREDEGFTLIELMVVVLIIAILLAIAIPTFLGARNSANARSAQSNLRNADTAEQTIWSNSQAFDTSGATISTMEPSLTFTSGAKSTVTPGRSVLLSADTNNDAVVMTAAGADGNCYSVVQVDQPASGVTTYTAGTYYFAAKAGSGSGSGTTCSAPTVDISAGVTSGQATASGNLGKNWATSF